MSIKVSLCPIEYDLPDGEPVFLCEQLTVNLSEIIFDNLKEIKSFTLKNKAIICFEDGFQKVSVDAFDKPLRYSLPKEIAKAFPNTKERSWLKGAKAWLNCIPDETKIVLYFS